MARLVVIYQMPEDPQAFDKYFFETHVPIAKRIPGVRKIEISKGPITSPAGASNVHLVATLHFDSVAAIGEAFLSAQGRASKADLVNFVTQEPEMFIFETQAV